MPTSPVPRTDLGDFPDIETLTLDVLEGLYPQLTGAGYAGYLDGYTGVYTGPRLTDTETPANLQDLPVFIRVTLVTGRDDRITDRSVVDIDVFASSRAVAYAWAKDIRSRLTGGPHRAGSGIIDRVVTEEKPRRLPWSDENVRRFGSTYRISARR